MTGEKKSASCSKLDDGEMLGDKSCFVIGCVTEQSWKLANDVSMSVEVTVE